MCDQSARWIGRPSPRVNTRCAGRTTGARGSVSSSMSSARTGNSARCLRSASMTAAGSSLVRKLVLVLGGARWGVRQLITVS